jgi:hypothetical protein
MKMNKLIVNSFAKGRHFGGGTSFSQCTFTPEDLVYVVEREVEIGNTTPGYRDGVVLVRLIGTRFTSPLVQLQAGDRLEGSYEARREGEEPRVEIRVVREGAEQAPAVYADIVLYASDTLAEDGDNELPTGEDNWEVVSINAGVEEDGEGTPLTPGTLMANHFHESGGTETQMSDSEFVEALRKSRAFWKGRALLK